MKTKVRLLVVLMAMCLICHAESLPRVDLRYTTLASDTFNIGDFQLVQDSDTIALPMQVRHRGATSLSYDKPSYAVKLYDTLGVKVDTALLDMRSDNYWILDAMAIDKARMRNRVAMDLWLEFSRKPWYQSLEPKMINGYRGKMVEVYVNNSPQGIYCLMERVDRKQLKLKKYSETKGIQGTWYKAWNNVRSSAFYLPTTRPVNTSATYDSWEVKYPDMEDGDPITWQPLYHLLQMVQRTGTNFSDSIAEHLDIPVFTDYVLLCQLLSARDNERKNVNLSFYHAGTERALFTPWDMDHSWGRMYNSQEELPNYEMFNNHQLYSRLNTYYHFQDTLAARYTELRGTYFSIEHIDSLFAPYFDMYARTGMDTVEAQLWSGHNGIVFDIPSEQQYIHDWVELRLEYLDSVYNYTEPVPPIPTDMPTTTTTTTTTKYWKDQRLYIQRGKDRYDIYGRKVEDDE